MSDPESTHAERIAASLAPEGGPEARAALAGRLLEGLLEAVVDDLVARGEWRGEVGRVRLEALGPLPAGGALGRALARRRARLSGPLERTRLGRLYELCAEHELAAQCYRPLVAAAPLALVVEQADAAAAGGRRALALAGVDAVAAALAGGWRARPRAGAPADPIQQDPLALAALLERAAEVALRSSAPARAAALLRTAAELLAARGEGQAARRALAAAARALRRAGQGDLAAALAGRLRQSAQEDGDLRDEALAMEVVAEHMTAGGELDKAIHLRKEAAKLLHRAGDLAGALQQACALAGLHARAGEAELARKTIGAAVEQAARQGLARQVPELREAAAALDLRLGRLGGALSAAEAARAGFEADGRAERAQGAALLLGRALALAGQPDRALELLASCGGEVAPGDLLRARADAALAAGRPDDARGLLALAERAFARASESAPAAAEARLRGAELAADRGDLASARAELARVEGAAELELRIELLRARLCEDEDERELLLDDLYERALTEGGPFERALAAAAKGRRHAERGEADEAREAVRPVVEELARVRRELPEALRGGLRRAPWLRPLLELAGGREDEA